MSTKKLGLLVVILVVILAIAGSAIYYLLSRASTGDTTITKPKFLDTLTDQLKTGETEYRLLYGKHDNVISSSGASEECKNFTMSEFKGGGIVKRDGTDNKDLEIKDYQTSYPRSKKYDNYYYTSASGNPMSEIYGMPVFDWDYDDQALWTADFAAQKSQKVTSSTADKFPGAVITSPDNKYLVYVMTSKKTEKFKGANFDPTLSDSDLIIRDTKSGEEVTVLSGKYNRQLFSSFLDFSVKEDSLFTIAREGDSYKFVNVELASGKVTSFDEMFPTFDWDKTQWSLFFEGTIGYHAKFAMSPDETKLLVYKNTSQADIENACAPGANHTLWSFNIEDNSIATLDEGAGMMGDLDWKNDSQRFAFIINSCGGCYPSYLDSSITKIDRDGQHEGVLVVEKKSKMVNLGWSPDEKEIVYDVYGEDFVSWLKSVDPESKEVEKLISSESIEGSVDEEKPVTLTFMDWVTVE
ncbi:MAG: hypothetical protein HQ530_00010 [Parcubacteria group bacterium]|nr:hypothetical protein [Parcubacteria group bacterium]